MKNNDRWTWWVSLIGTKNTSLQTRHVLVGNEAQTLEAKRRMMRAIHSRLLKEAAIRN